MPQLSDFYGLIIWIDIHADELMGAWSLVLKHLHPTKIRGLDK